MKERSLIRERVVMGLNRARKCGTRLGRPRVRVDAAAVAELRTQGKTWPEIGTLLGISRGSAQGL
jgi:DNA invertase Pin-like site-specific DNA recombinase